MSRYSLLGLLCYFALLVGKSSADVPAERLGTSTEVRPVGADELARKMQGKKVYSFEVLPTGELRAADRSVIPFHTLLEYLQSAKPDKEAFFEFRLSGVQMMNLASVAMDIFRQYGATNFSVKVPPGSLPPRGSTRIVPVTVAVPTDPAAGPQDSLPTPSSPHPAAGTPTKEHTINPETADKLLAGKLTYNFVVISAEEFVDQDGRHFSPHAIKAYLEKVKPERNAAYTFWLRDKSAVEVVKAAIPAFDEYGAAMIVVREMQEAGDSLPPPDSKDQRPKKLMLVGAPNPKALSAHAVAPDMLGRPVHLRPGKLPGRVRYQFKPDSEVVVAAQMVHDTLLDPSAAAEAREAEKRLLVQAGLWSQIPRLPELKSVKVMHNTVELPKRMATLECAFLDDAHQTAAVMKEVRSLIAADGGGNCRALRTDEMNQWWTYIAFDIEEPIFLIETKGGHHRFIVGCSDNQISQIDDLNAEPTK